MYIYIYIKTSVLKINIVLFCGNNKKLVLKICLKWNTCVKFLIV